MLSMEGSKLQSASGHREIFTKAVCGNITKTIQVSNIIKIPEGQSITQILGSTVTACQNVCGTNIEDAMGGQELGISISGSMQAHVWYAYNNSKTTDLVKQDIKFNEAVPIVGVKEGEYQPVEAQIAVIREPTCIETSIVDGKQIKITVELEVSAQVIGETKIWVRIYQPRAKK